MKKKEVPGRLLVSENRRAHHKYHIEESYEAGLALLGSEVKAVRAGGLSLDGAFARIEDGAAWLYNMHIPPYPNSRTNPEPRRTRKLLLHKKEINRLQGLTATKGVTLIPLELYFKDGWAKVSIGVAKAKQGPDRRDEIKRRDIEREEARRLK